MPEVKGEYPGKSNKPLSDAELKAIATAKYESKVDDAPQSEAEVEAFDFPTEIVELPSRGMLYPADSPLSKGTIEMKYMTAKEEDILSNQSFIKNGVVLDKLFKALIVSKCDYNEMLLCDKNAVMIAARVLGYGKDYEATFTSPTSGEIINHTIDLTQIGEKEIDWSVHKKGQNHFDFELPNSKRKVTLQIMTQSVQRSYDKEIKGLEKLKKSAPSSTLLKYVITSLDGDTDNAKIRKFVDNQLLAVDARAIRKYLTSITPEIDMDIEVPDGDTGDTFRSSFAIGLDFFWPDAKI